MRSLGIGLAWNKLGSFLAQVVAYFTEGRVLDYSTDVGPFTIVDQSDEGNTATLYSGRGATIGPAANTITYPTGYGSAERTATVWMRVDVLGARTLNGATGTFTFTPTATGIWEQLSSTATVSGNLSWTPGSDCDISDLTCATEHWTHDDFSNPTGDTSNGKTIVDSGPNQLHGTCTGCAGFTGEGIDPDVAGIVGLDDYIWFDGVNDYINKTTDLPITNTSEGFDIEFDIFSYWAASYRFMAINSSTLYRVEIVGTQLSVYMGGSAAAVTRAFFNIAGTLKLGSFQTFRITYDGSAVVSLYLDGSLFGSMTLSGAINTTVTSWSVGASAAGTFTGSIKNLTFGSWIAEGNGVTSNEWGGATVHGNPVTVGQKRATIPQTVDRNWNKYQCKDGSSLGVAVGTITLVGDFTMELNVLKQGADFTTYDLLGSDNDNRLRITALDEWRIHIGGTNTIFAAGNFKRGEYRKVTVSRSGTNVTLDVDGIIDTKDFGNSADFIITHLLSRGASSSSWIGSIDTININNVVVYSGLGNDPWKNTGTGGATYDGTESGTFTRELVSASDANNQIDACGTAILEPRTNAQVVNIFGEGELVKTPAAASLDTIKAVSGWIWHDGTARTVIDLGTPTVGTTATDLTSSGFTGVTYFVNGQSGTTLSAGWNHCVVASTAALATDDIDILAKSGSSIDYITTLTVTEALQNFDAQKALYNTPQ